MVAGATPRVGVLSIQGDVREHAELLAGLGVTVRGVKRGSELAEVDALVIPGGESTTISLLLREHDLIGPLRERIEAGMPVLGTCAGAILLAAEVHGGAVDTLGVLDIAVTRNGYGRQVDSFETDVDLAGHGGVHAVFIRAPVIDRVGDGVDVLAEHDGHPVVVRAGRIVAATFHPELSQEPALHRLLVAA